MKKSMLVIYTFPKSVEWRSSYRNHLMCFGKYLQNINVFYYHYDYSRDKILYWLKKIPFDFILFDRSFFYLRDSLNEKDWKNILKKFSDDEGNWKFAVKGILPQDEYRRVDRIREFVCSAKVDVIYTLVDKNNRDIFYPKKDLGYKEIYTILPGYVEESDRYYVDAKLEKKDFNRRKYDIGYRARRPSYALGDLGILKSKITDVFNAKSEQFGIKTDIGNTEGKGAKRPFYDREWFDFLMDCRATLGSLSGSSIMDTKGEIMQAVDNYLEKNPKASYDTVKKELLDQLEGNAICAAPSPRIFEAAMTKTCQVLVEGDYKIIVPGVDYIELKTDFSNIDAVCEKIKDTAYCEKIANNAYSHLIQSNKYTYRTFTKNILKVMVQIKESKKNKFKYFPSIVIRCFIAMHDLYQEKI